MARNWLYDQKVLPSVRFDTNVIGVGNLSLGGTGKTPFITYLIEYFTIKEMNLSVLSRGYGRSSIGFRQVTYLETPKTVGDEPYLFLNRYPNIGVFVGEDRVLSVPQLLMNKSDTEVILLDDSFQYRALKPNVQIALTTYQKPFYRDFVVPSGRLRESRQGIRRADCVIVTNCPPDFSKKDEDEIKTEIQTYTDIPVFFTVIEYGDPVSIFKNNQPILPSQIGISGIASAQSFEAHLHERYNCEIIHHYNDHHRYSKLDVKHLMNELNDKTSLLTTEKDMVKLRMFSELREYSCFYIPIKIKFLSNEALFHSIIDSNIKKNVIAKDPL